MLLFELRPWFGVDDHDGERFPVAPLFAWVRSKTTYDLPLDENASFLSFSLSFYYTFTYSRVLNSISGLDSIQRRATTRWLIGRPFLDCDQPDDGFHNVIDNSPSCRTKYPKCGIWKQRWKEQVRFREEAHHIIEYWTPFTQCGDQGWDGRRFSNWQNELNGEICRGELRRGLYPDAGHVLISFVYLGGLLTYYRRQFHGKDDYRQKDNNHILHLGLRRTEGICEHVAFGLQWCCGNSVHVWFDA